MPRFYDISQPISAALPVWPGDPPVTVTPLDADALPAVSHISLSSHAGTHVDAPAHFMRGGATVDMLPLDVLIGPAWVTHLRGREPIGAPALAAAGIPYGTERLLIRTINSDRGEAQAFDPDFVALAPDAASWLMDHGVRLVGIDGPSIEPYEAPGWPVHRALLGAGILVVENLLLADVPPGPYQFICLPLPIRGCDGAPVRAVLIGP